MRWIFPILFLSGCTIPVQLQPTVMEQQEVMAALKQHAVILDAIVQQIGVLQEKGYLEKPKVQNETK